MCLGNNHGNIYKTYFLQYLLCRMWQTDLPRGACVIVETSVEHKAAEAVQNSVRAVVLASRYLIEPCGSGKSRLMHLSRIDLM